jgi:hypothetical protein
MSAAAISATKRMRIWWNPRSAARRRPWGRGARELCDEDTGQGRRTAPTHGIVIDRAATDNGRYALVIDNAAVVAELAASFAIDETIDDTLIPGASQALRGVAELVMAGRVSDVRADVKSAYEVPSYAVRNDALAEIERRLEAVRELVTVTLQERDGSAATEEPVTAPDIDDWRAQLARFGTSLPVPEGDLVEPPSYDGDRCDPRPNPVYIEVLLGEGIREACSSNNWRYLGGSPTRPEGQGSCVWCPSGYYWRSGWGCCFPE